MRLPRKRILVFTSLALLIFVGWFLWQLFGPDPAIVVSRKTTFITAPLRPDGLPDYEKYILEKMRDGVTAENNGAVPFWQAMGPGEMTPEEFALVAQEIGLENRPATDETLKEVYGDANCRQIKEWLKQNGVVQNDAEKDFEEREDLLWVDPDELVYQVLDQASERSWSSEQIPPLADWAKVNEKPLNLLVEAAQRPHFSSPPPSLLKDQSEILVGKMLPTVHASRAAARALSVRAMWHLGEGRPTEAWRDILAIYQISRLIGNGGTLLEHLVGISIEESAMQPTLMLLDDPQLSADQLRQVHSDLRSLEQRRSLDELFNDVERLYNLDWALSFRHGTAEDFEIDPTQARLLSAAIDWNVPLRMLNEFYDEIIAVAKLPSWDERMRALEEHEKQLQQIRKSIQWQRAAGSALSRDSRSKLAGEVLVCMALPTTTSVLAAEYRGNSKFALTQVAAALAVYRAEHGEYPGTLDALVPDILHKTPHDLFHDNPYVYRRTENGYYMYSLGPNNEDDEGCSLLLQLFKGYYAGMEPAAVLYDLLGDELPKIFDKDKEGDSLDNYIPDDADDIAIRVPLPKLELPKARE